MYVATIIPIARGIPFDILNYYSVDNLAPGTLVSVPFGKNLIAGIVVETVLLSEAKTLVKNAKFSLKKVKQVLGTLPYFEKVSQAISSCATKNVVPIGAVAGAVIPQFIFEYINKEKVSELLKPQEEDRQTFSEKVIANTPTERTDTYKRMTRSSLADKRSVLFVAPTIRSLEMWRKNLEKGIQKHVVIMHSKISKKDLRTYFSLIKSSDQPLLIFATPGYAVLPRFDIGTLIVEDESSNLYKTQDRYNIDLRIFLHELAKSAKLSLCWGDSMPRFETLIRLNSEHLPRTYIPEKLRVVSVEHYRSTLPSEVIELLRYAEIKKRRIFIYTNRKGLAPISRCAECSTIVSCPTCTLPVVLRNVTKSDGSKTRSFMCTHCGESLSTDYTCSYCGSWNISTLNIGTESLYEEIGKLVGNDSVFVVDDDITPDSAIVEKLIGEFSQKKFAIVIGTTKALPYLKNVDYTIVPFFDRILSVPSIYTTENILRTIMECNDKSSMGVLICTRNKEFPIIKQLENQRLNEIIKDELELRRSIGYPPYGTIIKISITVPMSHRHKIKEKINEHLAGQEVSELPARRISLGSMKVLMVWIIKAPNDYIESEGSYLVEFLEGLRFPYRIEQNPERL